MSDQRQMISHLCEAKNQSNLFFEKEEYGYCIFLGKMSAIIIQKTSCKTPLRLFKSFTRSLKIIS